MASERLTEELLRSLASGIFVCNVRDAQLYELPFVDEREIKALATEVLAAREALKFYAEQSNYRTISTGFAAQYDPIPPAIMVDGGEKAREILESVK